MGRGTSPNRPLVMRARIALFGIIFTLQNKPSNPPPRRNRRPIRGVHPAALPPVRAPKQGQTAHRPRSLPRPQPAHRPPIHCCHPTPRLIPLSVSPQQLFQLIQLSIEIVLRLALPISKEKLGREDPLLVQHPL